MGRFGTAVAKAAVAVAIGTASMSAFVPAAHAVDGCMATVEIIDDAGNMVSQNQVPCTGGMQNGHAYIYDTHGNYVAEVSNGGYGDPPLAPLTPSNHSGGGSTGGSHSSTSGSSHGSGTCRSSSRRRPPTAQTAGGSASGGSASGGCSATR